MAMASPLRSSKTKKLFDSYRQRVSPSDLNSTLCLTVMDNTRVCHEYEWVLSKVVDNVQNPDLFGDSLGLRQSDVNFVVQIAPRDKSEQVKQLILKWSMLKGEEATIENLLRALYLQDEVDLIENICQGNLKRLYGSGYARLVKVRPH